MAVPLACRTLRMHLVLRSSSRYGTKSELVLLEEENRDYFVHLEAQANILDSPRQMN